MKTKLYKALSTLGIIVFLCAGQADRAPVAHAQTTTTIIYVGTHAAGANNGLSWADAYTDLQTALAAANDAQIWVAQGTYTPGAMRTDTFTLRKNVAIYGGFAGGETALDQRLPGLHLTTLSGDLLGDDVTGDFKNHRSDNSYHVVTSNGMNSSAMLDGFTVKGGYANDNGGSAGGGMLNYSGSPTLTKIVFSDNSAPGYGLGGGGMANQSGSPVLTNVTFSGNMADQSGGGLYNDSNSNPTLHKVTFSGNTSFDGGGGMYNGNNSSPVLTNVTFSGNIDAGSSGGGMYNSYSNGPVLTNVTFSGNTALGGGGGMENFESSASLTNVTFSGNSAHLYGGGMDNYNSSPILRNVTFSGNHVTFLGGGIYNYQSSPTLQNVILWGNNAPQGSQMYNDSLAAPTIADSVLQAGCPPYSGHCVHILTANPLLGALGRHGGFTQTIPLRVGSSALDTGNNMNCPSTDQRGIARPKDGDGDGTALCDIGAYEMGSAGALAFSVSPVSWNYGLIKPGTTSALRTFTIKNAGSADLVLSGAITLTGANASQFHILSGGTCSNATLQPSHTCTVTVAFKPTIAGSRSASLRVPDNALGHPHTIALSGKGGIELAVNGGFNTYSGASKIPAGWTAAQFTANDGKDIVNKLEGSASLKITGRNPARTKTLTQTLTVSGAAGNAFTLVCGGAPMASQSQVQECRRKSFSTMAAS